MNPRVSLDRSVVVALVTACFVVLTPLLGCDDGVESPENVVRSYLDDLRRGEQQQALEAIWPRTREQLLAGYDDLEDYFEGEPPMERAEMLVVTRVENPMVITRIRTVEEVPERPSDGERVELKIEFRDDRTTEVDVRWGADNRRWYVDLPLEERRPLQVLSDEDKDGGGEDDESKSGEDRDSQQR